MRRNPGLPRHALDPLAVVQHDDLRAAALQDALLGPGRGRDLDAVPGEVLHEDVDQATVRPALLGVEDRLAVGVGAESPGRQQAELRIPHAAPAQLLGPVPGLRPDHERQPGEADRNRHGQRVHRQVQPLRADPAGPDRRHFALVVEPAEGEHRREQHADRHEHHQVLERREADQRQHDVVRESALGRDPEDPGELVAHEDREQHDRDAREGYRDFAQDIAVDGGKQGGFRAANRPFSIKLAGHGKPARHRAQRARRVGAACGGSRIMQFHVIKAGAARKPTACAIVGIHENAAMSESARRVDRASGGAISRVLKRGDFAGRSMETFPIVGVRRGPAERILLVGLGSKSGFGRKPYRRAIYAATQWLAKSGAANAVSWLAADGVPGLDAYYAVRHAVESVNNALYRIPDLKTAKKPPLPKLSKFGIVVADADAGARRARRARRARHFGRHGAHEGSREPARERLHALLPRRCREGARQGAQEHQRKSAHTRARSRRSAWARSCRSPAARTSRRA